MKRSAVHVGHRQRLRSKYKKSGLRTFAKHEALELLLFPVIPMKNTNDIAHGLLNRFGSLAGVANAERSELEKIKGMTERAAELLSLLPTLIDGYAEDCCKQGRVLSGLSEIAEASTAFGLTDKGLLLFCMNGTGNIIHTEVGSEDVHCGTVDCHRLIKIAEMHRAERLVAVFFGASPLPERTDMPFVLELEHLARQAKIAVFDIVKFNGESVYSFLRCLKYRIKKK